RVAVLPLPVSRLAFRQERQLPRSAGRAERQEVLSQGPSRRLSRAGKGRRHLVLQGQERGGSTWSCRGRGEPRLIPDFEFLSGPEANRQTFRVIQMCNWLQGLESSTDPAHTTYLHRRPPGKASERSGADITALRGTEPPQISIQHTGYGTRISALHDAPNGRKYFRVN